MAEVLIYTKERCPYCVRARALFEGLGARFEEIRVDRQPELRERLSAENGGWRTVPMIFVAGRFLGGFDDVAALHRQGKLVPLLEEAARGRASPPARTSW